MGFIKWNPRKPLEDRDRVEIELMETFDYLREIETNVRQIYHLTSSIRASLLATKQFLDDPENDIIPHPPNRDQLP